MRNFFACAGCALLSSLGLANLDKWMPIDENPNSAGAGIGHIVSSSSSVGGPWNGLSIGQNVGATRFYGAGFTGTRSIVSSVEGDSLGVDTSRWGMSIRSCFQTTQQWLGQESDSSIVMQLG